MDIVSVAVLALLSALLAVVIKQYKPEYAVVITIITAAVILIEFILFSASSLLLCVPL